MNTTNAIQACTLRFLGLCDIVLVLNTQDTQMNDPRLEAKFLKLERTVDASYAYIKKEYDSLELMIDNEHYDSAKEVASNIRKTITLIKNTRRELDAIENVDVSSLPVA